MNCNDQDTCTESPLGYKQTPWNVALFMAALLNPKPFETVYDPSTGGGMLIKAVMTLYAPLHLIAGELNSVYWKYSPILSKDDKDQVSFYSGSLMDRKDIKTNYVIMNSPFKNKESFDHIRFVVDNNLKLGGRLVAFISRSDWENYVDTKCADFKTWVYTFGTWNIIPVDKPDMTNPANCDKDALVLVFTKDSL